MIILPKKFKVGFASGFARPGLANALKTALSQNKIELAVLGYFLFLEISFFGGYYFSRQKISQPEPLKPFLGMEKVAATESAQPEVAASETENNDNNNDVKSEPLNNPATAPTPAPPPSAHTNTFPTWGTPNNKFGMYINASPDQIGEAAPLINSNGGDWGWVLLPIDVRQRDGSLWQNIFDACAAHHIKPLIQLFNNNTCDVNEMDFPGLARFFNELSWPTQHLYISVFNEVNAKDYWCEELAPEEYAVVLNTAIDAFKGVNQNFFIMPAGFNSSCRSGPRYLDEEDFLLRMNATVPGIFTKIDGWATHAYPQPEFSGDFYNPPSWYGIRDQIENYKWEMGLLSRHFGVSGLPIFITETGWAHSEGYLNKWQYKSSAVTARYFDDAYRNHWLPNNQIVAIMPFVWYKPDAPNFNWKRNDGSFYPQYNVVMSFPKVAGTND
jgi:hypothetical protein